MRAVQPCYNVCVVCEGRVGGRGGGEGGEGEGGKRMDGYCNYNYIPLNRSTT